MPRYIAWAALSSYLYFSFQGNCPMNMKRIFLAIVTVFLTSALPFVAYTQDTKLKELHEKGAAAPMLKSLDADTKRLSESFKELLIKEGFADRACTTTCTVSCTWVNGTCQPTTSCSLKCDL